MSGSANKKIDITLDLITSKIKSREQAIEFAQDQCKTVFKY
jgi:hypothetical protein